MKKETLKLHKSALTFTDHDCFAKSAPAEEGKSRTIQMTAYSGKIVPNHWYWGDLAIDTSGLKMAKKTIPILHDHDTDRKIGFGSFEVSEDHSIKSKEVELVDTPFSAEFVKLSDQGFPYEASIFARPSKIQRLMEKEEAEVNGFMMKGPGTIWRESVLKECSVCTFGADANTKSVAMTEGDEEMALEVEETKLSDNKKEEVNMDLVKLKAEHPEVYAQAVAIGKQEAEATFTPVKLGLEQQISDLTVDKTKLTDANKDLGTRVLSLEKSEALRIEQGIKMSADALVTTKLKASSHIPERLYSKIRKQLDHEAFVKDGKLDATAFSAAIDTELKDWAPVEGETEGSILGLSFTHPQGEEADTDKLAARLLGHVGQAPVH